MWGPIGLSSIYSSNGTSTRLLSGPIEHTYTPLMVSVSGNGLMASHFRGIIDIHTGTLVGGFGTAGSMVGGGPDLIADISINNDGSVAFTGGHLEQCSRVGPNFVTSDAGVFRSDGETTTIIALFGGDKREGFWLAYPSINDRGIVAFMVAGVGGIADCPVTPGIIGGDIYVGDGTKLKMIAQAHSAPSLNNRGEVGFIGVTNDVLSIVVSDGKRTRVVANTNGSFVDFPGTRTPGILNSVVGIGPSINDSGTVTFIAALDFGGLGIFTGSDVVNDKVIAVGDVLAGSSVAEILISRQSLNNSGEIAFQAILSNGTIVVMRPEPKALAN